MKNDGPDLIWIVIGPSLMAGPLYLVLYLLHRLLQLARS